MNNGRIITPPPSSNSEHFIGKNSKFSINECHLIVNTNIFLRGEKHRKKSD